MIKAGSSKTLNIMVIAISCTHELDFKPILNITYTWYTGKLEETLQWNWQDVTVA